ncbi:MAG TPA: response regulator [Candidatus Saccharimonadales bacterium]|nr:response regulator [Candidatus Saccharimonadales bacterium]
MAKVLLVEDDNNLREIYEARLQAEGYNTVTAQDGEEALVVAKNEHPDLVISDVMMPKISGFEMLDILRNTDGLQDVKVIMLTALGQSEDQQRAGKLGADRYLVKSQVTLEDIVKASHELLQDTPGGAAPAVAPVPDTSTSAAPATDTATTDAAVTPTPAPVAADTSTPAAPVTAAPSDTSDDLTAAIAGEVIAPQAPVTAAPDATPAAETTPTDDTAAESTTQTPAPIDAPAPAVTTASASADAANDQLMSAAVSNLVDTDTTQDAANAVTPENTPPLAVAVTQGDKSSNGGHDDKVVTPLTPPAAKPDLNALLAKEEAKEQAAAATPDAPATPASGDQVDPNSIAL